MKLGTWKCYSGSKKLPSPTLRRSRLRQTVLLPMMQVSGATALSNLFRYAGVCWGAYAPRVHDVCFTTTLWAQTGMLDGDHLMQVFSFHACYDMANVACVFETVMRVLLNTVLCGECQLFWNDL